MTVSCRRSARGCALVDGGVGAPACAGGRTNNFSPQELQNFAPGGFSCRQLAQVSGCGAPHWLQKRLAAGKALPQLRHVMATGRLWSAPGQITRRASLSSIVTAQEGQHLSCHIKPLAIAGSWAWTAVLRAGWCHRACKRVRRRRRAPAAVYCRGLPTSCARPKRLR
jgi:hypothetical protein